MGKYIGGKHVILDLNKRAVSPAEVMQFTAFTAPESPCVFSLRVKYVRPELVDRANVGHIADTLVATGVTLYFPTLNRYQHET